MNTVLASIIFLVFLVAVLFGANAALAVRRPDAEKVSGYECGFCQIPQTRQPFNVIFYLVGLLFVIVDLEIAILYPIIASLGQESAYLYGLAVVILFLVVLAFGFVYEFGAGALHISEQRAALKRSTL